MSGYEPGGDEAEELVGMDEGEAGGGEHAGLGVDGFAEVLGADERMVAAMVGKDALHDARRRRGRGQGHRRR